LVKSITGDVTLTPQEASNRILEFTGTLLSNTLVKIPVITPYQDGAWWVVINNTSGGYTFNFGGNNGASIRINQGKCAVVYALYVGPNASDIKAALTDSASTNFPSIGRLVKNVGGSLDVTLTMTECTDNTVLEFTGTLTGPISVIFPYIDGRSWDIFNNTTGDHKLTIKVSGQPGFVLESGKKVSAYCGSADMQVVGTSPLNSGVGLIAAQSNITMTDADYQMTLAEQAAGFLNVTGTLSATRNLVLKDTTVRGYVLINGTNQSVTLKTPSGSGVTVAANQTAMLYCNGTNVVRITADN
jgi:hypothetical protein